MMILRHTRIAACRSAALAIAGLVIAAALCASLGDWRAHGQTLIGEFKASRIAAEEFHRYTQGQIKSVSMSKAKDTQEVWGYFFTGEEEFARPGFYWYVEVNKKTGATPVVPGE